MLEAASCLAESDSTWLVEIIAESQGLDSRKLVLDRFAQLSYMRGASAIRSARSRTLCDLASLVEHIEYVIFACRPEKA